MLIFSCSDILPLIEHSERAARRIPTFGQMCDPACRKDGAAPNDILEVSADQVDIDKVPAGLWLVGDHGVYLLSNGESGADKPPEAVYAHGCDPRLNADFYRAKNSWFGADDGTEFLPLEDLEKARIAKTLVISMTEEHLEIRWAGLPE